MSRSVAAHLWAEPGSYVVAPGVYRIPLPLPGDGLRAVNVYVIEDGGHLTLIDAGWHRPESWDCLRAGLRQIGAGLEDVNRVLVTHIHYDHYGQAAALRRATGAKILLGVGEESSVRVMTEQGYTGDIAQRDRRLRIAGAQILVEQLMRDRDDSGIEATLRNATWEGPDSWLRDDDTIELSNRSLRAIETPGHTRGHLTFLDHTSGLFFVGDHVLPHITPSIGFEPLVGEHPLMDFLLSLSKVRDLNVEMVLPAHGFEFADLRTRVDELLAHHGARLTTILKALGGRERVAFAVAQDLPWTSRARRYGDLDLFNRTLAVLETALHLDLLAVQGTVDVRIVDGVNVYSPAPPGDCGSTCNRN
jgi:glyoxylase-like metal-dependent hydrolase (beta-lactamase superfamily II)